MVHRMLTNRRAFNVLNMNIKTYDDDDNDDDEDDGRGGEKVYYGLVGRRPR